MGVLHHCHNQNLHYHNHIYQITLSIATLTAALTFLLFTSAASARELTLHMTQHGTGQIERNERVNGSLRLRSLERVLSSEKRMSGPGSSPPTCRSKCGRCSPCKPAHVPIQPGMIIPLEYYPEAWRCKCGNKIFMP